MRMKKLCASSKIEVIAGNWRRLISLVTFIKESESISINSYTKENNGKRFEVEKQAPDRIERSSIKLFFWNLTRSNTNSIDE